MEFRPPEKLSFEGDVAGNWKKWKQMFELYLDAKDATGKSDKVKIGMLLSAMGPDGVERFNNFKWVTEPADQAEDKNKYDHVMTKFNKELSGDKRIVFNRFKFWGFQRAEQQPFDDYLTQLRTLAKQCEFQEIDNMLRDKIVFSSERGLTERLLRERDLDLNRTIDLSRATEVAKQEIKTMKAQSEKSVDSVNRGKPRGWPKPMPSHSNIAENNPVNQGQPHS